jgi:hypothetical protein
MANNTDSGFEPGSDNQPSPGASTVSGHLGTGNSSPFGGPDQQLYGGTGTCSPVSDPIVAPRGQGYEGRHRAAD